MFENFLDKQHNECEAKQENYKILQVGEKVKLLNSMKLLPLVGDKESSPKAYTELYKILSEGVHKLSEEKASKYFTFLFEVLISVVEQAAIEKAQKSQASKISSILNDIRNPKEEAN